MKCAGWMISLAALLALAPLGVRAATEADFAAKTTGDLVALCSPSSDSAMDNAGVNFCAGFFQGAVLVEQQHEANPRAHQFFCLPDPRPTRNDVMKGFVAWANASPDRLQKGAVDGVIAYLGETYPCGKHR